MTITQGRQFMLDNRIREYRQAIMAMKHGDFALDIPVKGADEIAELGSALIDLSKSMEAKFNEILVLSRITENINAGLLLDDVLNQVYDSFKPFIPYDRIGFSLIDDDGATVRARWARAEYPVLHITKGYAAPLEGSSLLTILETGMPRILNDLEAYLREHPDSMSTRHIVAEGIRSSLTCPLIALGKRIGFIFFSSLKTDAFHNPHTALFLQIAGQLSVIVEKGRLYQQMLELSTLKNNFLGLAAHDLRNPLSAIKLSAEMIAEGMFGPIGDEAKALLNNSIQACGSMSALINDLLDVSAIASGNLTLHLENVSLAAFITGSVKFNKHLADRKSISLENTPLQPDVLVSIDTERCRQVLDNLLSNAIKYSKPGTWTEVRSRLAGSFVEVIVIDQGAGIAPEDMSKLFTEFGKTRTRPTAGEFSTGLGLAIAKRIVDAHGGTIWATSEHGKGSTFGFTIPQARK
ncbi:MAG: ATP-binding protein [Ignavibacteriales bacterium]|nr:ATP-binding protein [Ignavibacteriales bacterium]